MNKLDFYKNLGMDASNLKDTDKSIRLFDRMKAACEKLKLEAEEFEKTTNNSIKELSKLSEKIRPSHKPITIKLNIPDFSPEIKEAMRLSAIECRREVTKRFNQSRQ